MSNGKVMRIVLIVGLIKKISYVSKNTSCQQRIKMSEYFPKSFTSFGRNINVKVDLSHYATKKLIKKSDTC